MPLSAFEGFNGPCRGWFGVWRRLVARLLPRLGPRLGPERRAAAAAAPSLRALTAAALALPGLTPSHAGAAEGDEAGFQYGRYEEGERRLFGVHSKYEPIQVDSLHGSAGMTLSDRLKFAFNYIQDTWSGATPVTTAPLAFGGNHVPDPDSPVSGASPLVNGSKNNNMAFDHQFQIYKLVDTDPVTGNNIYAKEPRSVHTIASASAETRKQGDFTLGYEWDDAALDVGGGVSLEDDYDASFVSLNGRWDLNQKLTSLNLGLSYTSSDIAAIISDDAGTYIDSFMYEKQIDTKTNSDGTVTRTLNDVRQDWAPHLGLTQVLNKNTVIDVGVGYTRSTGFLENPYKAVEFIFVDPNQIPDPAAPGFLLADVRAVRENRPDERNQWTWDSRLVHYFEDFDAALHLDYRFFHDDWGINAHIFEALWDQPLGAGWKVTPRIRYYSQNAADFYQPYFLFKQGQPLTLPDPVTFRQDLIYDQIPVGNYSSDYRLSGFGALSGGVSVSKRFAKGVSLEAGFEYYTHQGDLKLGGGGEGNFADFDSYLVNAALRVDLSATGTAGTDHDAHAGHHGHHGGHGAPAPAGVMFAHMLNKAGDFMVGYRYMFHSQSGDMLRGTHTASDLALVARGCGEFRCTETPTEHTMHMHMLDIMYAPTDWLNLMLMPQFMDMDMSLRNLPAFDPDDPNLPPEFPTGGHEHGSAGMGTGGVGDTLMFGLVKLLDVPGHQVNMGVGLSAPTGAVDLRFSNIKKRNVGSEGVRDDNFVHYGMQLGSGTWDFRPSLTYTGQVERWSWGVQLSGVKRLEDKNESGFAFGDLFQSTAWGSYNLLDWLSVSVRGVYTTQGSIHGEYNGPNVQSSPLDIPSNYGGRFWDVGFGLTAVAQSGTFKGSSLGVEWLQPVEEDVNGYQLERDGTLNATWNLAF